MTLILNEMGVIPGTDPQDGGYDTFLNFVATRDPTTSEPLMPYTFPWLPFWWQTANSSDSWATYATSDFWLCVNSTVDDLVWWRMVFDANILAVLNSQGWNINTTRGYTDQSALGFNASRQPSLTNDTEVTIAVALDATFPVNFQISADNVTYETIAILGIQSNTCQANPTVPAGYYYQLAVDLSATPTLVVLKELSL